jgi:hypothetical protein
MTDQRKFTCVALHDKEMVMATGDISGRIIVWHKFTELSRPIKTVFHWHTLPVNALCFSTEGITTITFAFRVLPALNAEMECRVNELIIDY